MIDKEKNIFLINSHANTVDKVDKLRNLIVSIKNDGFKIMLISHLSMPQDIIDRCDYFLFDKENPMVRDINAQYWNYFHNNEFKILWKNRNSYSHFLAYYRLIFGGMNYINSMGFEIVHSFDYDIVFNNFDEIYDNINILSNEEFEIVSYRHIGGEEITHQLNYFSTRLENIDLKKMKYDSEKLLTLYRKYFAMEWFPVIENILYNEFLPKKIFIKDLSELNKTAITNMERAIVDVKKFDFTIFNGDDNNLRFFFNNPISTDVKIEIIVNNNYRFYICNLGWHIDGIGNIEEIKDIVVYIDNDLYLKYDMTNKDDYDMVTKHVKYDKF